MDYAGLEAFRLQLESRGWHIEPNRLRGEHNECNWYAWMRDRGITPDCACNDKPPSLTVHPYTANWSGKQHSGVKLEICGQLGDEWLKLQVYTLTPENFFERYAAARNQLAAAWAAAAKA